MKRREFLTASLAASFATATADANSCDSAKYNGTFVLVHGANHGGWCWRDVRNELRKQNFNVFTPTLTGLGERSHLVSQEITLQDHIDDVVNAITNEELDNIILVGHSYGGTVITGVCDLLRERISKVIYLDANKPGNGEATIPNLTKEMAEKALGEPLIDGYLVPPLHPVRVGINPNDTDTIEWLQRRLTPHPIGTLQAPLELRNGGSDGMDRSFILTTPKKMLQPFAVKKLTEIQQDESWNYHELLVGHEAMITAPCEIAELLVQIAA